MPAKKKMFRSKFDTTHKSPVVRGIHAGLKRQTRHIKVTLNLTPDEHAVLAAAAKTANSTLASFIRSAALFSSSLYLQARNVPVPEIIDEDGREVG